MAEVILAGHEPAVDVLVEPVAAWEDQELIDKIVTGYVPYKYLAPIFLTSSGD